MESRCLETFALEQQFGAVFAVKLEGLTWFIRHLPSASRASILGTVQKRLEAFLSPDDLLEQTGDGEFAFFLSGLQSSVTIFHTASRLLCLIRQSFWVEAYQIHLTASIGIAIGENTLKMLQEANLALHKAQSGINRIEFYDAKVRQDLKLDLELRQGIRRGELRLYYQPIVALPSQKIIGMEALVRWQHPQRGLLFPDTFIEIAERTQAVEELFDWVFQTGCTQAEVWDARQWFVSINLSPAQLGKQALIETIDRVVAKRQIPPASIYLEITETLEINYSPTIKQQLEWLQQNGIGVEIDDFGTGYSSILNLTTLPISAIKIDRHLLPVVSDSHLWQVIDAIIQMAHALNLKVIAEGVETQAQAEALQRLHCDAAQGYLWSKPRPPETFDLTTT